MKMRQNRWRVAENRRKIRKSVILVNIFVDCIVTYLFLLMLLLFLKRGKNSRTSCEKISEQNSNTRWFCTSTLSSRSTNKPPCTSPSSSSLNALLSELFRDKSSCPQLSNIKKNPLIKGKARPFKPNQLTIHNPIGTQFYMELQFVEPNSELQFREGESLSRSPK